MVNQAIKGGGAAPAPQPGPQPGGAPVSAAPAAVPQGPGGNVFTAGECKKCKGTRRIAYKDSRGIALWHVCQDCQPGKKQ